MRALRAWTKPTISLSMLKQRRRSVRISPTASGLPAEAVDEWAGHLLGAPHCAPLRPQLVRFLAGCVANTGLNILVYWAMLWAGLAVPLGEPRFPRRRYPDQFHHAKPVPVFDNRDPWKLLPYFIVWSTWYAFNLGLIWLLMRCGVMLTLLVLSTPATVLLSYFFAESVSRALRA